MIFLFLSVWVGCSNKKEVEIKEIPTQKNIYEHLLNIHEKYGAKKEDLFYSTFRCNPEQISEKVVIALDFSSEIFKSYSDEITDVSSSSRGFKVTNIKKID